MQFLPKAKFNQNLIRYSQCWEDTDLVLKTMSTEEGDTVLSIASAGDNTLSLLTNRPGKVIAVDFCQAQLAVLSLKMAAFKLLTYEEILAFLGVRHCSREDRFATYRLLREQMSVEFRQYFDERPEIVMAGIISSGKLERYFSIFRRIILPLVHSRKTIDALFEKRTKVEKVEFFEHRWNTAWYQLAFKLFFGKGTMALIGREASFFKEATGSLSTFLALAAKAALTEGEPSSNHYLHYILKGEYGQVLPHYLRPENFEVIRAYLDKIVLVEGSLQKVLDELPQSSINAFNLSDVFEYMTESNCQVLGHSLSRVAKKGARIVYWNMAVDRLASTYDHNLLASLNLGQSLAATSTTFFYKRFCLDIATAGAG